LREKSDDIFVHQTSLTLYSFAASQRRHAAKWPGAGFVDTEIRCFMKPAATISPGRRPRSFQQASRWSCPKRTRHRAKPEGAATPWLRSTQRVEGHLPCSLGIKPLLIGYRAHSLVLVRW